MTTTAKKTTKDSSESVIAGPDTPLLSDEDNSPKSHLEEPGPEVPVEEPGVEDHPENRVLPEVAVASDSISLDNFVNSRWGKHREQAAGFVHYARRKGLVRAARVSWDEHLAAFETAGR